MAKPSDILSFLRIMVEFGAYHEYMVLCLWRPASGEAIFIFKYREGE